jgi:uncharacterized protein
VRLVWVVVLLSTAAGAAQPERAAGQVKAGQDRAAVEVALARRDDQCPGGTVRGCQDAAAEAGRKGELARVVALNGRVCDAGVGSACAAAGDALASGYGVARDDAQAARRLQRGCELGEARACNSLGTLTWQGRGVKADPARAFKLYMRACDGGEPAGCFSAAICHRTGTCAPKSAQKAEKLLRRACDGGEARACSAIGGR